MINNIEERFINNLLSFDIKLSDNQLNQFREYYRLLIEWNGKINLTTITEYEDVLTKHFLDSLSIAKIMRKNDGVTLIDIGTGAGFPGIPVKIVYSDIKITLLDSLQKRITFLDEVIENLKLESVETIHGRAEDFANHDNYREQYDICVSRAVANLSTLSELCMPYVKVGGSFISYKSEKADMEIKEAQKAVSLFGGDVIKKTSFTLPDTDYERNLLEITKIKNTPKRFPRKAGTPAKQPIK